MALDGRTTETYVVTRKQAPANARFFYTGPWGGLGSMHSPAARCALMRASRASASALGFLQSSLAFPFGYV